MSLTKPFTALARQFSGGPQKPLPGVPIADHFARDLLGVDRAHFS